MKIRQFLTILFVLAAITLVFSGCGKEPDPADVVHTTSSTTASTTKPTSGSTTAPGTTAVQETTRVTEGSTLPPTTEPHVSKYPPREAKDLTEEVLADGVLLTLTDNGWVIPLWIKWDGTYLSLALMSEDGSEVRALWIENEDASAVVAAGGEGLRFESKKASLLIEAFHGVLASLFDPFHIYFDTSCTHSELTGLYTSDSEFLEASFAYDGETLSLVGIEAAIDEKTSLRLSPAVIDPLTFVPGESFVVNEGIVIDALTLCLRILSEGGIVDGEFSLKADGEERYVFTTKGTGLPSLRAGEGLTLAFSCEEAVSGVGYAVVFRLHGGEWSLYTENALIAGGEILTDALTGALSTVIDTIAANLPDLPEEPPKQETPGDPPTVGELPDLSGISVDPDLSKAIEEVLQAFIAAFSAKQDGDTLTVSVSDFGFTWEDVVYEINGKCRFSLAAQPLKTEDLPEKKSLMLDLDALIPLIDAYRATAAWEGEAFRAAGDLKLGLGEDDSLASLLFSVESTYELIRDENGVHLRLVTPCKEGITDAGIDGAVLSGETVTDFYFVDGTVYMKASVSAKRVLFYYPFYAEYSKTTRGTFTTDDFTAHATDIIALAINLNTDSIERLAGIGDFIGGIGEIFTPDAGGGEGGQSEGGGDPVPAPEKKPSMEILTEEQAPVCTLFADTAMRKVTLDCDPAATVAILSTAFPDLFSSLGDLPEGVSVRLTLSYDESGFTAAKAVVTLSGAISVTLTCDFSDLSVTPGTIPAGLTEDPAYQPLF